MRAPLLGNAFLAAGAIISAALAAFNFFTGNANVLPRIYMVCAVFASGATALGLLVLSIRPTSGPKARLGWGVIIMATAANAIVALADEGFLRALASGSSQSDIVRAMSYSLFYGILGVAGFTALALASLRGLEGSTGWRLRVVASLGATLISFPIALQGASLASGLVASYAIGSAEGASPSGFLLPIARVFADALLLLGGLIWIIAPPIHWPPANGGDNESAPH